MLEKKKTPCQTMETLTLTDYENTDKRFRVNLLRDSNFLCAISKLASVLPRRAFFFTSRYRYSNQSSVLESEVYFISGSVTCRCREVSRRGVIHNLPLLDFPAKLVREYLVPLRAMCPRNSVDRVPDF